MALYAYSQINGGSLLGMCGRQTLIRSEQSSFADRRQAAQWASKLRRPWEAAGLLFATAWAPGPVFDRKVAKAVQQELGLPWHDVFNVEFKESPEASLECYCWRNTICGLAVLTQTGWLLDLQPAHQL